MWIATLILDYRAKNLNIINVKFFNELKSQLSRHDDTSVIPAETQGVEGGGTD